MEEAPKQDRTLKMLRRKLDRNLREQNYYDAQQDYKALLNRLRSLSLFDESVMLCASGSVAMLKAGEVNSGWELANQLISTLESEKRVPTEETAELIKEVVQNFPRQNSNQIESFLAHVDKCVLVATPRGKSSGFPPLNLVFGEYYRDVGAFSESLRYFVKSSNFTEFAKLLIKWGEAVDGAERGMVLAKGVLEALGGGCSVKDAATLYAAFVRHFGLEIAPGYAFVPAEQQASGIVKDPMANFVAYLITALDRRERQVFQQVRNAYEPGWQRDPRFVELLDMIGKAHFNIPMSSFAGSLQEMVEAINTISGAILQPMVASSTAAQSAPRSADNK